MTISSVFTVRQFVNQMYRLISASNPVIPLHGDDESLAIRVLNQILRSYASSGLMLTIANTVTVDINLGINTIRFAGLDYPTTETFTQAVTLASGFPTFNVVDASIFQEGAFVSGNGIPANTFILSIAGNVITLSQNATLTGGSVLTFVQPIIYPGVALIQEGRLANLDNAWLLLSGVTYPLIAKSRDEYLASWKYEPLQGLPRFAITFPQTNYVDILLYPAPSQFYKFFCRGKFQLGGLTANDDMGILPEYMQLYLLYAVAKYVCKFKGRGSAWTPDLEADYRELKDNMEAASEVNLSITGDEQSLLNGAWRVRAGV